MSAKDHEHRPDFDQHIQETHGSASTAFLRVHLSLMHDQDNLRKPWDELVTLHDKLHNIKPEENPMSSLISDPERKFGAALLQRLAENHLGELDHSHLPIPGGDTVEIVAVSEVESWLIGCAIRLQNGADL